MIDIDQIRISAVGVYLRWDNVRLASDAYTNESEECHHQASVNFSTEKPQARLKKILAFLSDGDFNSRKQALDVALDKYQVSMASSFAIAASDDRSYLQEEPSFDDFMRNAQRTADMIENPDLLQVVADFFASEEGAQDNLRLSPSIPNDIKKTIMQQKLKGDNDGDGIIDNSFEAIARRLGTL